MFPRKRLLQRLNRYITRMPVTVVLGARQVGKTDLVRQLEVPASNYFDLEDTLDALRLEGNIQGVLGALKGTVVIDEAQEMPEIFRALRPLADRRDNPTKFVLTGSVSPWMIKGVSESLAGRAAFLEMGGFTLEELAEAETPDDITWRDLWLKGSMPRALLADPEESLDRREHYLSQLINRDLRIWGGLTQSSATVRKLLALIADSSGQAWSSEGVGQNLSMNRKTVQSYVDTFIGAFLARELQPYTKTARKRLRKSPKIMLRDPGLMHALLGVAHHHGLQQNIRYGSSWETFCTDQVIRMTETKEERCFSWTIDSGPEVDLILDRPDGRYGFEFKAGDATKITKSMRSGVEEMDLDKLYVVFAGEGRFPMDPGGLSIEAVGIKHLAEVCLEIRG